ncbi:MAG: DUF885 domain-containing protein [Pirellulales bacterium]
MNSTRTSLVPAFLRQLLALSVLAASGLGRPFPESAMAQTAESRPAAAVALQQVLDELWQFELVENPLFATNVGQMQYNDRLPRESPADQARRAARKQEFLDRLEQLSADQLTAAERLNRDILRRQLRDDVAEFQLGAAWQPITSRSGFHISFPELPREVPLGTVRDYENYAARLRAFPTYVDDHVELMREGLRRGLVLPAVVLEGYRDSLVSHIVDDPARSLFHAPLDQWPAAVPEGERERLRTLVRAAITDQVVPGYRRFLKFMEDEYVPAARSTVGAAALPGGREFYRHRVRLFTTTDLTPEQVHETGLAEVRRIRGEMEAIMRRVEFRGDFADFLTFLRTDPRFYATTPEQLQKEVAWILKRIDGELPRLFRTLPRTPYGLRVIPDYIAPRTTSAYYQPPTGDGRLGGYYYLNTFNLKSRPLYEMEALSLHEAVPGHHLQLALQQELTGLPNFRRHTNFTAFIEGWALYAERLGLEVGFYRDPYSDFGRLTFEMWRACRLVVDTGIHYLGWTREQAIAFMTDNTALAAHNIRAEVDRYIGWPGQALGYKIGELKIRQLRSLAEQRLGAAFDVREFHDVVLRDGALPLAMLEDNIHRWLAERTAQGPPAGQKPGTADATAVPQTGK